RQDAVLEGRSRLVSLEAARQGDRPTEAAPPDLGDETLALARLALVAELAADRQGAVLDGDVDVLGLDARQGRFDHEGIRRAGHVERKLVGGFDAAERAADEAVLEQSIHRRAKRHELAEWRRTAHDRHIVNLLAVGFEPPDGPSAGT